MSEVTKRLEEEKLAAETETEWQAGEAWQDVCASLHTKIGTTKFNQWVVPLRFGAWRAGRIILIAPTKFFANWMSDNYGSAIKQAWQKAASKQAIEIIRVDIIHQPTSAQDKNLPPLEKKFAPQEAGAAVLTKMSRRNSPVAETPLNENMSFDSFVAGESNLLAYKTALEWSENYTQGKSQKVESPLFICGSIGQGKTHLLHAMAAKLKKDPQCQVMNLTAERFRSDFVNALRQKEMHIFKQRFYSIDILIMDDLQFLSGEHTQKEFLQLLNLIHDRRGKLIFASTEHPAQIKKLDENVRSRLGGGLVVDIYPADNQLRQDIIRQKLRAQIPPLQLPDTMIQFLADNITTNIRALEGALNRIIAHTRHLGKTPDNSHARLILRDLLQTPHKQISVSDIQDKTAKYFDISLHDLLSARRQRDIARPRQIAMFLAKQLTPRSLPDIGRRFGGRDHTTVLHALRRIEELCSSNAKVQKDVANIKALCQSQKPPQSIL
jgi:chromosomal replication initiator protein